MDTLGLVETKSIAAGVMVADLMMKRAMVELVRAGSICSGRYMIQVSGDQEAVNTAMETAKQSKAVLAGAFVISNICPEVIAALKHSFPAVKKNSAICVVESRTATSGIAAADAAIKASGVTLAKLVTGQGIMGKSYFVLAGELTAVEAATFAAREKLQKNLIDAVIIPNPDESVMNALINRYGHNKG